MSISSWFDNLFKWSEDLSEKRFTVMDPHFPQLIYDISLDEMKEMLKNKDIPNWWKEKYQQVLDENRN